MMTLINSTIRLIPIISEVIIKYMNNPDKWISREDKLEDLIDNKEDLPRLIDDINQELYKTIYRDSLSFISYKGITYGDLIDHIQNSLQKFVQNGKN